MNPVKCPNCRLSLPQNWAGMADPNAKCPYCGKPLGQSSGTTAPAPVAPAVAQPSAPRPAGGAKTILWGVGAPIPGVPSKPVAEPPVSPVAPTSPLPVAQTVEPPMAASEPAQVLPQIDPPSVEIEASAPVPVASMVQPASRPNQPAPTVMYDPGVDGALNLPSRPAPEPEPPAESEDVSVDMDESEPSESDRRPTPSRSKAKVKPGAKRGPKPRKEWSNKGDADEDSAAESEPAAKNSKTGLIIFLACVVAAIGIVAAVALRGKSKPAVEETAKPEPLRPAEPAPAAHEEPPAPTPPPPPPTEKPARAEKTTPPAEKPKKAEVEKPPVEKPARAEKLAEKASAEPTSPKASAGKPSEADYRQANDLYQQGNSKLFQGNTAGAIADFNHALKLNPKDPAIHRGLGLAYAQSGKSADAIKHLKTYLKESPKANDRALIEKRLDQLQGK
jgi:hypothetical protein